MGLSANRKASLIFQKQTEKTADFTVVIVTDSGKVFSSSLDGMVITLPSIAAGEVYTFINTAEDGDAAMNISPAAADGIMYAASATDDKDLINTKATSKKGDYIILKSSEAGTVAWQVVGARGIWAKEA